MADELSRFLAFEGKPVQLVERSPEPSALITRMVGAAPWLSRVHVPSPDRHRLTVSGSRAHGEILFMGPVQGRVAEALVILVRSLATFDADYDTPASPQLLQELEVKVGLGVYVSHTCAFCPAVMAAALRFAQATPWIDVAVIRADLEPLPGQRSVPTVIANGEVVSEGSIGEYELAERVHARFIDGGAS